MRIQCTKCVMDRSASEITFDENGVCNFCHQAQRSLKQIACDKSLLGPIVELLKDEGKGKKYDCLIGLSGGVDSSYTLHKAVELGLRPFCFSVDNGWNDEKADDNIMRLVETLKVPFYRIALDLAKFRDLQAAFIKAGLINVEMTTDHILMAATFKMAEEYDIKYIISGGNVATESVMPASWSHPARDLRQIKAVYKWATGKRLEGLPTCSVWRWNYYRWILGLRAVYLLDYFDYNRNEAARILTEKYGWQEYGDKHCESVFTAWFQSYYLFEKFGIDKRKAHLSAMINSGQITRPEALATLEKNPIYPKTGFEKKALQYPKRKHSDFPSDEWIYNLIASAVRAFK